MHSIDSSEVSLDKSTVVIFESNTASRYGGATFCHSSDVTFDGNSSVRYVNNRADTGGAVHCTNYANLIIGGTQM